MHLLKIKSKFVLLHKQIGDFRKQIIALECKIGENKSVISKQQICCLNNRFVFEHPKFPQLMNDRYNERPSFDQFAWALRSLLPEQVGLSMRLVAVRSAGHLKARTSRTSAAGSVLLTWDPERFSKA